MKTYSTQVIKLQNWFCCWSHFLINLLLQQSRLSASCQVLCLPTTYSWINFFHVKCCFFFSFGSQKCYSLWACHRWQIELSKQGSPPCLLWDDALFRSLWGATKITFLLILPYFLHHLHYKKSKIHDQYTLVQGERHYLKQNTYFSPHKVSNPSSISFQPLLLEKDYWEQKMGELA